MIEFRFTRRRLVAWCLGIVLLTAAASIAVRSLSAPDSHPAPTTGQPTATAPAHTTVHPGDRLVRTMRPGDWVMSLAFSPNGRVLASATNYGTVQLWDVATGRLLATLVKPAPDDVAPNQVVFSPDGKTLAVCCVPRFQLVDVASRKVVHSLASTSWSVAFSPDGRNLALGGQDGIQFVSTSGRFGVFTTTDAGTVAYSPDGSLLASNAGGSSDGQIQLRSAATGSVRSVLGVGGQAHRQDIMESMAFSPDGTTIATSGSTGTHDAGSLLLWNLATGAASPLGTAAAPDPIHGVAYSPDGHVLASVDDIGRLRLWDTATKRQLADLSTPGGGPLQTVAVSPRGGLLATGSSGGTISLWNVGDFVPVGKGPAGTPRPPSVAPAPSPAASVSGGLVGAGTDCGSAGVDSEGSAFRLVVSSGRLRCADAFRALKDYATAPGKQGSGGFVTVDGWSCGHNSMAGLAQTGVYLDCRRGADEFDTQRSSGTSSP